MKRFFGKMVGNDIKIEGDEFLHLKKVLRMEEGDNLIACLNDEYDYYCQIKKMNKNDCILLVKEKKLCQSLPSKDITLFQMIPKKEYLDNIISKSIELGVSKIIPFISEYTMIREIKRERVENQIMTACKQCERSKLIEITDPVPFKALPELLKDYDLVIFAYERSDNKFSPQILENKSKIALIIGNEGGFSPQEAQELQKVATTISLGKRILRCDTAVISLLSLISILTNN